MQSLVSGGDCLTTITAQILCLQRKLNQMRSITKRVIDCIISFSSASTRRVRSHAVRTLPRRHNRRRRHRHNRRRPLGEKRTSAVRFEEKKQSYCSTAAVQPQRFFFPAAASAVHGILSLIRVPFCRPELGLLYFYYISNRNPVRIGPKSVSW